MKRKKEKYINTPLDKFCKILLYVVLPFIVALFMFLIKFTSNASEVYFPMEQNANNIFTETDKTNIDNSFNSENYYIFVRLNHTASNGRKYCDVLYYLKTDSVMLYAELNSNGHQFSIYKVGNADVKYRSILLQGSEISLQGSVGNNQFSYFQNNESNLYLSSVDYISNFKVYNNNTDNKQLVLKYGSDEVPITTGHATPPDEFQNPVYTTGHTPPSNVPPTITVNNYTWTTYTPPAIDDSGIIEVIKSEIQVINYLAGWLKDNLQGMLTNLVNNIKNLFDYLVETIQYYGDLIISNIQNLVTTFYNNMVSIGEDITDKLTYIVSPLDTSALQTAIENTGIYNDYERIFDMVSDAFGFYNDIQEPTTFTIPIDLRNVTILHQTQILYIDLGWLNSCKTIIRAFMWCVLTFGLLYTIIDSIPEYLQGHDE